MSGQDVKHGENGRISSKTRSREDFAQYLILNFLGKEYGSIPCAAIVHRVEHVIKANRIGLCVCVYDPNMIELDLTKVVPREMKTR